MIAQRSTILSADTIAVMKRTRHGSRYASAITRKPVYRKLYELQFKAEEIKN